MKTKTWSVRTLAALSLIVCAQVAGAQVTVINPWVRGTVEGQTTTAAYMTLMAQSDARLVSVKSTVAAHCSVHEMTLSGNVMKMRTLEEVAIPAGGSVALQEGHDHLMLEDLTHALKPGDAVPLTLTLVDSRGKRSTLEVQAPVVPLGMAGPGTSPRAISATH